MILFISFSKCLDILIILQLKNRNIENLNNNNRRDCTSVNISYIISCGTFTKINHLQRTKKIVINSKRETISLELFTDNKTMCYKKLISLGKNVTFSQTN